MTIHTCARLRLLGKEEFFLFIYPFIFILSDPEDQIQTLDIKIDNLAQDTSDESNGETITEYPEESTEHPEPTEPSEDFSDVTEIPDAELNTFKDSNKEKGNAGRMVEGKELASIYARI